MHQHAIAEIPVKIWDVVVIGAGPAGSTTAARLAENGFSVLLTDREEFPRDKACGDLLLGDALQALDRLDLLDKVAEAGSLQKRTIISSPSAHAFEVNPKRCITIPRRELDSIIAEEAMRRGATFCRATVKRLEITAVGEVRCHVSNSTHPPIRTRAAVVATGSNRRLLQQLDLCRNSPYHGIGARYYLEAPSSSLDALTIAYDQSTMPGYAWIFPVGNGVFNVGCGLILRKRAIRKSQPNLRAILDAFLENFPAARELRDRETQRTAVLGGGLRTGMNGVRTTGRIPVIAVGEAVGATLPLTGEGIGKAMETGEIAAENLARALHAGDMRLLEEYPRELVRRYHGLYSRYRLSERWFANPFLNDITVKRISRSPFLRQSFVRIPDENVDPLSIFSPKGLLSSYIK